MTLATLQREIRVFLSSTFRDMDAERHYLVTRVFPEIRQICYQRMVNFSEIDLLWGITEEAAHNGRTVQICLEEIERCRSLGIPPFFIGFLGERYGWVPQAEDLAAYWQQSPDQRYAGPIHAALQENISVTELEIRFAFLAPPPDVAPPSSAATARVQMFLRDPALTAAMANADAQDIWFDRLPDGTPDSTRTAQLAALKQRLREQCPQTLAIDGYHSVEQFGEAVKAYLLDAIDTLYPVETMPDHWQQRSHEHAQFAAVRRRAYVPLTAFRQQLVIELNQGWMAISPVPWLITASSGMGKSAFLADLESTLGEKNRPAPMPWDDDYVPLEISERLSQDDNYRVFSHYIGADGDTTLENWRNRLFWHFADEGESTEPASNDDRAWQQVLERLKRFRERESATLVLILDAINQFAQPELAIHRLHQLEWPGRVLLVMTGTPEVQSFIEQQNISWKCHPLPALAQEEREALCQASLSLVSKSLSVALTGQLITAPACNNPLFMRLVLEELCLHARHEALPERLDALLACTEPGALFTSVLQASDSDFSLPKLVTRAACAIAAARRGLTHGELSRILAIYPALKVPDSELVPLLARLAPYCQNSDGRLRLLHGTLATALQSNEEMEDCRDRILAVIKDSSGFALAERTWQWLSLGEIDPVIRELSEVMAVIRLHDIDPALLHTVWQLSGIYEGKRFDPRFEQTFEWTAPAPAVLQNHLPAVLSIFTWLRQARAEKAATQLAEMIQPTVDDDNTPTELKAHFYNTLSVLAQKTHNPALAKASMEQVLENLFNPGEAGMKMLAVTMSNMAQQLNAAGKTERALELYQKAKVAAMQPPRDPAVLANIIMQIAQIKARSDNAAETEQHLQEAVTLIEQMPPTPQRQIMLSSFYQELATVYLMEKDFARAAGLYDRAIAAVQTIYRSDASEIRKLEENRDLFYRLAQEHGQAE